MSFAVSFALPFAVPSTPLHHKPVAYGSDVGDALFLALVAFHAAFGAAALVASIVAMVARKGGRRHLAAGDWFVRAMGAAAVTGAALVLVRLTVAYAANHIQYPGTAMPSTIPARLAFLYASVCVLYMAWGVRARVVERRAMTAGGMPVAALLLAAGVGVTAVIAARLDPWTGALWMVWSFMLAVALTAHYRRDLISRTSRVREHRFALLFLGAFCWWGAAQGFGPAIAMLFSDGPGAPAPYLGDQPGSFHPRFLVFLVGWLPAYALAGWLGWRAARRRYRRPASS